jgi:hypothetical protein
MHRVLSVIWGILRRAFLAMFGLVVVLLLLAMFFGPPAALVAESVDLVRMRQHTIGAVTNVGIVRGSKGTSRASIEYAFTVGDRQFASHRRFPGFLGDHVRWTGGAADAGDYPRGQTVAVHYNAANPECCCLEYGWFAVSLALTTILWGMFIRTRGINSSRGALWRASLQYGGLASFVYGFGMLFLGPSAVRISDLHWHGLAWLGALAAVLLHARFNSEEPAAVSSSRP